MTKKLTLEDCKEAARRLRDSLDIRAVKQVIHRFGVTICDELQARDYATFIDACDRFGVVDVRPDPWPLEPEPTTVDCDQNCGALRKPSTFGECLHALEHWEHHSLLGGCSHGG
jgi:hypothetical protein